MDSTTDPSMSDGWDNNWEDLANPQVNTAGNSRGDRHRDSWGTATGY